MKKRYTNPVTEIVELAVLPIMTTTSVIASLGEEDGGVVVMISTNQVLPVAIGVESGTVSRADKFCPPFFCSIVCAYVSFAKRKQIRDLFLFFACLLLSLK